MATFVIVHGAWGGGWEWRAVANVLTSKGHAVFTPTLTGLGERSHLRSRSIGLATHATDVAELIRWEQLHGVLLVGHSYGGMVITVVASMAPERIRGLVYIDAFIPEPGQSEVDLIDPEWVQSMLIEPARAQGDGWLVPYPFAEDEDLELPPEAAERYRASPHPLATFTDPAAVDAAVLTLPSAFVHCTRKDPGEDAFANSEHRARHRGWRLREIHSAHDVQFEAPEGIASLLHDMSGDM